MVNLVNLTNYPVGKNSKPIDVAMDRILERYGIHCSPSKEIENEDFWIVPINVHNVKEITNREGDIVKRIFFLWEKVINLKIDKSSLELIKPPSRRTLLKEIRKKQINVMRRAESIMIQAAEKEFGEILYTKHQNVILNPLITLLKHFVKMKPIYIDTFTDPKYNFTKQGQILFKEKFIQQRENKIELTNVFKEKIRQLKYEYSESDEDIITSLLGYLFSRNYYYLKTICRINMLNPFINLSLSYYIPAIYYDDLLTINKNDLIEFQKNFFYRPRSDIHFNVILENLFENNILTKEGFDKDRQLLISGSDKVFNNLLVKKNTFINKYYSKMIEGDLNLGVKNM